MCTFRALDFIPTFLNAANHNPCAGLKYSFLLSVGNASQWMEPITESCSYCNNLVQKHPEETDECGVPFYLYDIINCVYSENYFRCPNYNPHQLPECDLSQQYNEICGRL